MSVVLSLFSVAIIALATTVAAHADAFPYASRGIIAPASQISALQTGMLDAISLGSGAGGEDAVRLHDVTAGTYSNYIFDNRSTSAGATGSFGPVTAGDQLVFEVTNSDVTREKGPSFIMASLPTFSTDGDNHFYVASVGSNFNFGAEDNSAAADGTDYTYDDISFSLSKAQVSATAVTAVTPEPSSFVFLGTGLLGAFGVVKSRLRA